MAWAAVAGAATSVVLGRALGGGADSGTSASRASDAASADATRQQTDIAAQLWNRYKEVYVPMQDRVMADANSIDSAENQGLAAGRAHADVTGAMQRQRQAALERLRSLGVNPSAAKFINANTRLAGREAALDAGAQNFARENVKAAGRTWRASLAQGGNGVASSAGDMFASAGDRFRKLAFDQYGRGRQNMQDVGDLIQPISGGVGDWIGGAGDWIGGKAQGAYDAWGVGSGMGGASDGGDGGAFDYADSSGNLVPQFANGGIVRGPGCAITDGEFIVPADVVRAKGTEYFRRLVESYVAPRRGVRARG